MMKKYSGILALIFAGLLLAAYPILVRGIDSTGLLPLTAIFYRNLGIFLIAAASLLVLKQKISVDLKKLLLCCLFGIIAFLTAYFFILSTIKINPAHSVFTLYVSSIVISMFLGKLFFKERLTKRKISALLLTLIALILITLSIESSINIEGYVLGFFSGGFDSFANTLRKYIKGMEYFAFFTVTSYFSLITSFVFAASTNSLNPTYDITGSTISLLLISSIFIFFVGLLILHGFRKVDLNVGVIYLSSEVFFSIIIFAIYLKTIPSLNEIFGGLLILLSIVVLNVKFKRLTNKV